MWLLAFVNGIHTLGSAYTQKVAGEPHVLLLKRMAMTMKSHNQLIDEVWGLSGTQYNQRACEMSPKDFTAYIRSVGRRIL